MGPPPPRHLDPTHPMYDGRLLSQQAGGTAKQRVGRPQTYSKLPAKQHAWYLEAAGTSLVLHSRVCRTKVCMTCRSGTWRLQSSLCSQASRDEVLLLGAGDGRES